MSLDSLSAALHTIEREQAKLTEKSGQYDYTLELLEGLMQDALGDINRLNATSKSTTETLQTIDQFKKSTDQTLQTLTNRYATEKIYVRELENRCADSTEMLDEKNRRNVKLLQTEFENKFNSLDERLVDIKRSLHLLDEDDKTWPTYWNAETQQMVKVPECVLCMDLPRDVVFDPCRHVCYCKGCFNKYRKMQDRLRKKYECPICRAHLNDSQIVLWSDQTQENETGPSQRIIISSAFIPTDIGEDWHEKKPDDPDHRHFYVSGVFGVASGQQEMRRDRFHDLIV